jgi:cephalosporin-C deacetylase-like acetyl esterase
MNYFKAVNRCFFTILLVSGLTWPRTTTAQITVTPDKPQGIYESGETVKWTLQLSGTSNLKSARYTLKKGGLVIAGEGKVNFNGNNQAEIRYPFDSPGWILLDIRWGEGDAGKEKVTGGAIADPGKLALSASIPGDFYLFWESKLKDLAGIPANSLLNQEESGIDEVAYWKISMDNILGSRIQGQLARPEKGDKLPALLVVQWAGIYPLQKNWVTERAEQGWLVLNINPHDLPIDEEPEFYQKKSREELKDYWAIGNDNREESYFLRMYLSCYRAAEYLTQRPDWDGMTLVVMGDSQGGQQALMTAGLHPGITACLALVPAGFDMLGPEAGRKGGWPQWYDKTEGKNPVNVHEASRYFDVANFIPRIKCPVLVGVGLLDETCPPVGILAALNQLNGPKEIILLPRSGHQDRNDSQKTYKLRKEEVWLPALRRGEAPPGAL